MKVFSAQISHETNRHSPIPTNMDSFREGFVYIPSTGEGAEYIEQAKSGDSIGAICLRRGHTVDIGVIADAQPGAPSNKSDFETLRNELLDNLKTAMPIDFVALFHHGAMVAEDYDDCEGEILQQIRQLVGPDVPIGVELDLHANVTRKMVENTTLLLACKEYPHTDFQECAEQLVEILEHTIEGDYKPTMAHTRVPMWGIFHTTRQPLRGLVDELKAMEGDDGIISISLTHGFIEADFSGAGAGVLVVTNNDLQNAQRIADSLANRFFELREQIKAPSVTFETAVKQVIEANNGTVVIAESSDNPGGGAAGDSTFLLQLLLENNIQDAVFGVFWDPMAVQLASTAGLGTTIPLRVGGKMGPMSGQPVDIEAKIIGVTDNLWQWAMGEYDSFGAAVAVEVEGIQIVIGSIRQQVLSPECFTNIGIDINSKRLIVVKSTQHFHATFASMAKTIIYSAKDEIFFGSETDSLCHPIWPLDKTPFNVFGKSWG